jgi:hypothetical protein
VTLEIAKTGNSIQAPGSGFIASAAAPTRNKMALLQRCHPAGLTRATKPTPTLPRLAPCRVTRRPLSAAGTASLPSVAPAARVAPQAPSRRLTVVPRAAASGAAATPAKPFKWCVGEATMRMGGRMRRLGQGTGGPTRGAAHAAKWRADPPTTRPGGARWQRCYLHAPAHCRAHETLYVCDAAQSASIRCIPGGSAALRALLPPGVPLCRRRPTRLCLAPAYPTAPRREINLEARAPLSPSSRGADMKNLAISIGVGVALALFPAPAGVTTQAWNLLAIFTGTIVGIITTPLPLGAVAILGLGVAMITKTLTFAQAFSAFANEIP